MVFWFSPQEGLERHLKGISYPPGKRKNLSWYKRSFWCWVPERAPMNCWHSTSPAALDGSYVANTKCSGASVLNGQVHMGNGAWTEPRAPDHEGASALPGGLDCPPCPNGLDRLRGSRRTGVQLRSIRSNGRWEAGSGKQKPCPFLLSASWLPAVLFAQRPRRWQAQHNGVMCVARWSRLLWKQQGKAVVCVLRDYLVCTKFLFF